MTRPEPGASITAAKLATLGYEPILAPCLTIRKRYTDLPPGPAAIIITSSQAIEALPHSYHDIPVFCVGDATAGRLRQAGFTTVFSASGDAKDLLLLVVARKIPGMHLLAVGERHGLALARQLREAGFIVVRRTVYTARPLRALPEMAAKALLKQRISAALFYSAESARAFTRLNPPGTQVIQALALSPAVAAGLHGLPWAGIHVASAPTEADLLALLP